MNAKDLLCRTLEALHSGLLPASCSLQDDDDDDGDSQDDGSDDDDM